MTQTQALCRQAAEVYASRLVDRFPQIRAVVLYGSVARGEASEDSDIDLMVIVDRGAEELPDPVFALGQELLAEFPHVMTQTIIEDAVNFHQRATDGYPLERTVARQGIALYDSDGVFAVMRNSLPPQVAEERAEYTPSRDVLREYLRAADDALREARVLFENRFWDGVSNRAYYAMFNAATAAALSTGIEEIRSHKALRDLFRHRVAIQRELGLDYAADLDRIFDLRLSADYKPAFRVTEAMAADAITTAERFLDRLGEFPDAA